MSQVYCFSTSCNQSNVVAGRAPQSWIHRNQRNLCMVPRWHATSSMRRRPAVVRRRLKIKFLAKVDIIGHRLLSVSPVLEVDCTLTTMSPHCSKSTEVTNFRVRYGLWQLKCKVKIMRRYTRACTTRVAVGSREYILTHMRIHLIKPHTSSKSASPNEYRLPPEIQLNLA
eukprot:6083283-Pleurochrysis_carterae.AAC.4